MWCAWVNNNKTTTTTTTTTKNSESIAEGSANGTVPQSFGVCGVTPPRVRENREDLFCRRLKAAEAWKLYEIAVVERQRSEAADKPGNALDSVFEYVVDLCDSWFCCA